MFDVYILKSLVAEKYYIGQSENAAKRLKTHNSKHARWTKRYQPWEIVFLEKYGTRSEAMKREKELKGLRDINRFLSSQKNCLVGT